MEVISDRIEAISDWDEDDINQAIILLGFTVVGLFGARVFGLQDLRAFLSGEGALPLGGWMG